MLPAAFRHALVEARQHDVLVVRGTRVLGVPGLLAGRARGTPVVLQPEINGELSGEAFTWGKSWAGGVLGRLVLASVALRNTLLRDACAFVAMSRLIRDELWQPGPAGDSTAAARRRRRASTLVAGQRAACARLGLPGVVPCIRRLLRGKGLETLVEALAAPSLPRDVRVVLLGSGEGQALDATEDLRRRVAERGLEARVVFAGRSDRVEDYLRACDSSSSRRCSRPSASPPRRGRLPRSSRTGGIVDVVDDAPGFLPFGDPAALEGRRVLAGDGARRAAMGAAARAVAVSRFDEREVLEGYRALFREVSSSRA
jgi:glycosyltransferase involved in cell wall biosynthesis